MRERSGGTRGQVRVFVNISAITELPPKKDVAAFLARYPQVDVHLQERISSAIVKAAVENEARAAVCITGPAQDGLVVFPYRHGEWVPVEPDAACACAFRRRAATHSHTGSKPGSVWA